MKTKRIEKKLEMNKKTVANLSNEDMTNLNGGVVRTLKTLCEFTVDICPVTEITCYTMTVCAFTYTNCDTNCCPTYDNCSEV